MVGESRKRTAPAPGKRVLAILIPALLLCAAAAVWFFGKGKLWGQQPETGSAAGETVSTEAETVSTEEETIPEEVTSTEETTEEETTPEETTPEETTTEEETEDTSSETESEETTEESTEETTEETTEEESGSETETPAPTEPPTRATETDPQPTEPSATEEPTEPPTQPVTTEAPTEPSTTEPQPTHTDTPPGTEYGAVLPVPEYVSREAVSPALAYQYGGYHLKCSDQKVIYLTFCLGYENGLSRSMMQMLQEKGVKAAFFLTGEYFNSANDPVGTAKEMLSRGHIIGSHGYQHVYSYTLSDQQMVDDFNQMKARVNNLLGDIGLRYYRPPYGYVTERDMYIAQKMGYITTMFSFYYRDYDPAAQPSRESALASLKSGLQWGAIYYLHVSQCNLQALPEFIDYARSLGYTFLRLDQSMGDAPVTPTTEPPTTEEVPTSEVEPVTEEPTPGETTEQAGTETAEDTTEEAATESWGEESTEASEGPPEETGGEELPPDESTAETVPEAETPAEGQEP